MAASVLLVVFGCLMVAMQIVGFNSRRLGMASVAGSLSMGEYLANTPDIVKRDLVVYAASGADRTLDLTLPVNARVFMTGMIGTSNAGRLGNYYYLTYYLFPREVAVTLDQPRYTADGFQGRSTVSDEEIRANGFDCAGGPDA